MIDLSAYLDHGDRWLYDLLISVKQDPFPDNFRISFAYNKDEYESNYVAGRCLLKLQEYLALIDIPNFFVLLHTNNPSITIELKDAKQRFAPYENDISVVPSLEPFQRIKKAFDSFCILPWMHLYVNPQGEIGPCCQYNESFPLGTLNTSTLLEVANNKNTSQLRKQLLNNERPPVCSYCWKTEDNGLVSSRMSMNEKFKKWHHLVTNTLDDGQLPNFKLRYLDFRANNTCNLMCRMCSGKFSSRIANEEMNLYNDKKYIDLKISLVDITNTLKFIEENINDIEAIYFAGGEPLIIAEHYTILDLLLSHNRTEVEIVYNSNMSTLSYKSINVINYWEQFNNITVNASIDLIGEQANYVRHGCDYQIIENNCLSIKELVNFNITSTLSLFNAFNLPSLQKRWIKELGLSPTHINFSILVNPSYQCLQVLPLYYKKRLKNTINEHINWLLLFLETKPLVTQWENVLNFIDIKDDSHLLSEFFRLNDDKDKHRNEKFENAFPEYKTLRSYV